MEKEFVIFPGLTHWSVARIDGETVTLATVTVSQEHAPIAEIESQLRELEFTDEAVMLALPPEDCLWRR